MDTLAKLVQQYEREQTRMEMDENTFRLLNQMFEEDSFYVHLMMTRATVGDKIVAVLKKNEEKI